jgi:TolA-binding protein
MNFEIIVSFLTVVAGSSTFITLWMYRKQQKRFKTAEAFGQEVTALRATVQELREQIRFQEERINKTQELITSKDAYINQLSQEKHTLEIKNSRNKSAINKSYGCTYCPDISLCPVLVQRAANEEEYLNSLKKKMI